MIIKDKGIISAPTVGAILAMVTGLGATLLGSRAIEQDIENKDISSELKKLKKLQLRNMVSNIAILTSSLLSYYWGTEGTIKPAAVIGGIPVGTALEVSHAMSNLDLKYRATGGVFLAHQEGGGESLRMVLETFGKNRYYFLSFIEFLFIWGSNQLIDMFAMKPTDIKLERVYTSEESEV